MCPWKTCCPNTVPRRSPLAVSTSRVAVHRELAHPRLHAVTPTETSLAPLVDVILHLLRDVAGHTTATWANER